MTNWFGNNEKPVHIVAHGMGGLVARAFISKYPSRWKMCGGQLIMLGTPNYGSWMIPQIFMGVGSIVEVLSSLYGAEKSETLVDILTSFPSLYQMLPIALSGEPEDDPLATIIASLFQFGTYGDTIIPSHLADAKTFQELINVDIDLRANEMICIVGNGQPTPVPSIKNISRFKSLRKLNDRKRSSQPDLNLFDMVKQGDGFVTGERAVIYGLSSDASLKTEAPIGQCYYVNETHGGLTSNELILMAIDELLTTGKLLEPFDGFISNKQPPVPGDEQSDSTKDTLPTGSTQDTSKVDMADFVSRIKTRGAAASLGPYVSYQERMVEEHLTRDLLTTDADDERRPIPHQPTFKTAQIDIVVAHGDVATIPDDQLNGHDFPPVDAIAVGYYLGVRPQGAMRDLDVSLSLSLLGNPPARPLKQSDLLLTQLSERGTLRGDLGQPFFLPDPSQAICRAEPGSDTQAPPQRVIAIAGMGVPGRFGIPELTVLARELCWALGRIGKRHLVTVLIGAGRGNLSEEDAVFAWLRGIKHAITGLEEHSDHSLQRVAFVEKDWDKAARIEQCIQASATQSRAKNRLNIGPDWRGEHLLAKPSSKKRLQKWKFDTRTSEDLIPDNPNLVPTRLTVGCKGGIYHFGAITQNASVPEREMRVDPKLIEQANNELAAEWDPQKQLERGLLLGGLLVPQDLRTQLSSTAPVVVLLDATTARIHWEAVAQRILTTSDDTEPSDEQEDPYQDQSDGDGGYFLGTTRGLTRQLRTTFSPPPDPPPAARRVLRVLIIADPAANAPLPGAQEEGVAITELFKSYNKLYTEPGANRIEVVSLIGPSDATRTTVLREIMLHSYDVLHFAGHCKYVENDSSQSGWVFSDDQLLTANELKRIDRVPKFIFSNACESGITPDRSEERSVGLAPSFAEAFFQQGVANFVCTAWPIDDSAARTFAIELYANMICLQSKQGGIGFEKRATTETPKYMYMYKAMQKARQKIQDIDTGIRTWGAYQHYGNPYLQFFNSDIDQDDDDDLDVAASSDNGGS